MTHLKVNDAQKNETSTHSPVEYNDTSSFIIPTTLIPQCEKDEYLVKTIDWKNKKVRIITQNENGPCPLVAICNVLFLRGDLEIQPPDRELVTFEYLVDRLGDYLLNHAPNNEATISEVTTAFSTAAVTEAKGGEPEGQNTPESVLNYQHHLDSALTILPNLKSGLDVNVIFDSIRGFEPTAELSMFDIFNVDLVHGWIIDPQDRETYDIIQKYGKTYNKAVEFIVQLDGNLEQTKKSNINYDDEGLMLTTAEEEKLHEGFIIKEFLKDTATQLTYYGLELLLDSIPEDSLCVLFRNNHFSTVYKHPDLGLYMLITDSGLVLERSIVWESLSDIDQGSSEFLDGFFNKPNTIISPSVIEEYQDTVNTDLDYAIAVSLQESESRQQRQQQQELNYNSNSSHGNNRQQPEKSGTTVRMKKSSLKRNNCVIC